VTNKEKLQYILDGGTPGVPPHFEIEFQLGREMFGLDLEAAREKTYASDAARADTLLRLHIELQLRLIDELGYASAYFSHEHPPEQGIGEVKKAIGDKALLRVHDWAGVFWMPTGQEMMDFVVKMFEHPEQMHAEARQKCDDAQERIRRQVDAGADFFMLCYDFGFNSGPFVSPAHFAEFVTPYLTEIVATVHDLGKKALLHSDGNINDLLDQIHSTGVDGYQSVDPQGHMDIKAVRSRFPDWILMGNVHCGMLQDTDERRIRESVQYCMNHGGVGKRYIFSTSNCIFQGMPPESYRIMLDEYHRIAD
jgi:uroporphyrinogen decarboxylase